LATLSGREEEGEEEEEGPATRDGPENALAAEIQAEAKKEMPWIWYLEGKTGKPEEVVKSERKSSRTLR
jgi:hypothetical protein